MGKVSIVRTGAGVSQALARALDLIGGLERYIGHGDRVMLKPNLNGDTGFTDIGLTEALIVLLREFGVRSLVIAESTYGNHQMTDVFFKKTGYADLAGKYKIPLINLNKSEAVDVRVRNPLALETLHIAREVFEADSIINLPVMKVHYAAGITLCLKNLKGLLVGDEKKHFHEVGLDKAIVDLNNTVQPKLNVVDCITCMERMGPRGGDAVRLNLLMAGGNAAEVDYTGMQVMSYELDEVRYLKNYLAVNDIDVSRIEVVGEPVAQVKYPFKKVNVGTILPDKIKVHDRNACSSCMNALLLSCQFLEKEVAQDVAVYMGTETDKAEIGKGLTIGFGNCCDPDIPFAKRIRGCPPHPTALKALLSE